MSTIEQQGDQAPSVPSERPAWHLPATRAVPAVLVGVAVTFLQAHDALVGLLAFAVLVLVTGGALLALRGCVPASVRRFPVIAGAAGVVAGAAAAALAIAAPSSVSLKVVVVAWALVAGAAEGWAWWAARGASDDRARRIAADWRFVAGSTILAGIVFAALPAHDVVLVGLLGAYAIIVGVFHGIAAFSARAAMREATA